MKRKLVALLTFAAGLYFFLEYVTPDSLQTVSIAGGKVRLLSDTVEHVSSFLLIVLTFALGLGWANLVAAQARQLKRKKGLDFLPPLFFFISVLATTFFGFWYKEASARLASSALEAGGSHYWLARVWSIIQDNTFAALVASVFSLLAFYIISAAYRAFRLKNFEATLMMGAAFIIMLGNVPVGTALTANLASSYQFPTWSMWLMNYINSPASRALNFGVAVGALAVALRLWLSLERGSFFEKEL